MSTLYFEHWSCACSLILFYWSGHPSTFVPHYLSTTSSPQPLDYAAASCNGATLGQSKKRVSSDRPPGAEGGRWGSPVARWIWVKDLWFFNIFHVCKGWTQRSCLLANGNVGLRLRQHFATSNCISERQSCETYTENSGASCIPLAKCTRKYF